MGVWFDGSAWGGEVCQGVELAFGLEFGGVFGIAEGGRDVKGWGDVCYVVDWVIGVDAEGGEGGGVAGGCWGHVSCRLDEVVS